MGKKRNKKKINSNSKQYSKTQKQRNKLIKLQKGNFDYPNCESQKFENTFLTKHMIGDDSNEWKKIREAFPEHYRIPDPDIFKVLKSILKNKID
ncbi:hypothetical protein V7112_08385 [Bacillus sp. JJ1566]|uniref:hypothetical protein n=1 Tax=Bacillus sp. JJ1566 TaxID=3122961 RepID=UPI002FFF217D